MNKRLISLLIVAGFITGLSATKPLNRFLENEVLKNANISLLVKDAASNKVVYDFRSDNSAVCASTMKLITTATALEMLGPDFRFETKLQTDGEITRDSVLFGNLYIYGSGDPTLGSSSCGTGAFLSDWVSAIRKAGIREILGNVITDATQFDDEGINPKWLWEDMGNYYAAGAYGISYLDNTFQLVLRSGSEGTIPEILRTIPEIPGISFENHLKSTNIHTDSAYLYGAPHENKRMIYGEIPKNRNSFIIKGDIPNPAELLKYHVENECKRQGIEIFHKIFQSVNKKERKDIYSQFSPPLSEIITVTNINSDNHYAEQVFRYLSLKTDSVASTKASIQAVRSFWRERGLPVDQLFMNDGCGLAPSNGVSARFFTNLLTYMKSSPDYEVYYNSLPVSGVSGTLKSLLKDTPLEGKVHAKSGSISRVKCYAGYMDIKDKQYIFAILVNNANGTSKEVTKKIEELLLSLNE